MCELQQLSTSCFFRICTRVFKLEEEHSDHFVNRIEFRLMTSRTQLLPVNRSVFIVILRLVDIDLKHMLHLQSPKTITAT